MTFYLVEMNLARDKTLTISSFSVIFYYPYVYFFFFMFHLLHLKHIITQECYGGEHLRARYQIDWCVLRIFYLNINKLLIIKM